MNWTPVLLSLLMMIGNLPVSAMQIDADPRAIISPMDKSLSPQLDILRVTTDISQDNHLVFQVKTRGEWIDGEDNNYLLLQILHEKTHVFLIPINKEKADKLLVYEGVLQPENQALSRIFSESGEYNLRTGFNARHIFRGVEFTVPIDWINFGGDLGFDVYTVKASIRGNILKISEVYDQARKGRGEEKRFSAITLLNKICTPRRTGQQPYTSEQRLNQSVLQQSQGEE